MPTALDAIKRLGCEHHGSKHLPSGREQVQLIYKNTRFAIVGTTPDELYEAALLRVAELMATANGLPRSMGKAIMDAAREWKKEPEAEARRQAALKAKEAK